MSHKIDGICAKPRDWGDWKMEKPRNPTPPPLHVSTTMKNASEGESNLNGSTIDITGPVRITIFTGLGSLALAAIKIATGIAGSSYALIADGIESLTDVVSSFAVLLGITYSVKPPDEDHPYG